MKKFLAALLSILLFLHLIVIVLPVEAGAASGDDSLALYAQSAVLMDADTGAYFVCQKRGGTASHGQHHQNHDPDFGVGECESG